MKVYKLQVNPNITDDTGVEIISCVEYPAMERDYLLFDKDNKEHMYFNEDKLIIYGVAIECDKPIYRNNPRMGEHYVLFDDETIKNIMLKMAKTLTMNNVDTQHNEKLIKDVYMIESFQIDRESGIDPSQFKDVNDKSWVVAYKVENTLFWNELKTSGKLNGFSISGIFEYGETINMNKVEINKSDDEIIDEYLNDLFK